MRSAQDQAESFCALGMPHGLQACGQVGVCTQTVSNAASDYSRVLYKIVSSCADCIRQLPKGSCARLQAAWCSTCLGFASSGAGAGVLASY